LCLCANSRGILPVAQARTYRGDGDRSAIPRQAIPRTHQAVPGMRAGVLSVLSIDRPAARPFAGIKAWISCRPLHLAPHPFSAPPVTASFLTPLPLSPLHELTAAARASVSSRTTCTNPRTSTNPLRAQSYLSRPERSVPHTSKGAWGHRGRCVGGRGG
jgi:hypothetical protein